jgi:poly(3-hydroxybutyrate) depolymerase
MFQEPPAKSNFLAASKLKVLNRIQNSILPHEHKIMKTKLTQKHLVTFISFLLLVSVFRLGAADRNWPPTKVTVEGRTTEVFRHGSMKEWGYGKYQNDTVIVVHPKVARKQAPLYVVLHSAGHNVFSAVKCTRQVGNHDIYHSPDNFYALYLDCRANKGDWWWGGFHPRVKGTEKNTGGVAGPTELRVIGTVKWAMEKYGIDPNRVYLCGNSMGGSGTLGIGLRNGDVFAAIKANVPAGIEHASDRMHFPPSSIPKNITIPDPPVLVDYSGQNDHWSTGHGNFAQAMNDRKYAMYLYWGPFGHANNHEKIMKHNDLINSFDWLSVKLNEAYPAFSNASSNDELPWPDKREDKTVGQVNAFFRWENVGDENNEFKMALFLISEKDLKTKFTIPTHASADVSLRRIQHFQVKPNQVFNWSYGKQVGKTTSDENGIITITKLNITNEKKLLEILPDL